MNPARKPTLADLDALPSNIEGEIIEGVLYTMTKPRGHHAEIVTQVMGPLFPLHTAPKGWVIYTEPGIELPPETLEISPDVAGWRRERLPRPSKTVAIAVVPDWVCEVLSPSTRRHDLLVKKPYYAKIGVQHHWIVDLEASVLQVYRLERGNWLEVAVFSSETAARIEPFEEVEFDVARWW